VAGDRRTIVVVGAGIGGLTAALALAAADYRVVVAERSEHLVEAGAGIQISPNAGRVLAGLGLDAGIAWLAAEPAAIDIRSGRSGRLLTSVPAAEFHSRYGFPYRVIHRADLQVVLRTAVEQRPDIALLLGATVSDVVPVADGCVVTIARGGGQEAIEVAAVIGADGVWSELREQVRGPDPARPVGRSAWRTLIAAAELPPAATADRVGLWLSNDAHLVHYPVAKGRTVNVVAIVEEDWSEPGWSAAGDRRWLTARFAGWPTAARELLAAAPAWHKWAITRVDPALPWVAGRLALLGDAAHAMPPFIAQGAAMAIEDAAVLARCLATIEPVEAALAAYEAKRRPRVMRVAAAAASTGAVYHWSMPRALVRDAAIRLGGARLIMMRNDWIYRWEAERA